MTKTKHPQVAWRERVGLSQSQLAARLDKSVSAISRTERAPAERMTREAWLALAALEAGLDLPAEAR